METNHTPTQKAMDGLLYLILGVMLGLFLANIFGGAGKFATLNSIIAVSGMSALCSFFLSFCYRPGAIFGWYMDWLEKYFRDSLTNPFRFLFNPLGGCMYCQNTWITITAFILLKSTFIFSWWMILPTIFMSHFILTVTDRILEQ